MSKKFDKLVKLLKELFQLDQPDLDFGLYRIMHSRSKEISEFLEKDLLGHVKDAFGDSVQSKIEELKKAYDNALNMAKSFGVENPENSEPVKKAKFELDAASEIGSAEDEIYDHLYRFFERYYDGGDFMSLRYLTRETSDKANAYAIPYDGSEVKLHWANADQYYVKTTEYFNNYTFKLRPDDEANPLRVHFRIADASEGEHGNIKESADKKRFFILYKVNPVSIENGELVIRFEFRNDADKTGQDAIWQRTKNEQSVTAVFEKLAEMEDATEYKKMLSALAPTDKDKNRTTLAKYLTGYTSRNTMDYFIHKDLGGFLRRELDFYIKNEIMRLDDIENAEAAKVEHYLGKIKVFRKIAKQIIAFLAQFEDFQKKLWLKKKFVYETNYCITLDRIPEEFYLEIAANERQREEWVKLFAIDEIKPKEGELFSGVSYTEPLTIEFLKANPYLVLDTALFEDSPFEKGGQGGFSSFKSRLIASIENFDEQCDGLLIHSENFQALNLLQERYREQVDGIYIDPPYNTSASEILYKNGYRSSSWLSLIANRALLSKFILKQYGVLITAIDDTEFVGLCQFYDNYFINMDRGIVVINHHPAGAGLEGTNISSTHEYAIFLTPKGKKVLKGKEKELESSLRGFVRTGTAESNLRIGRPNSFYAILVDTTTSKVIGAEKPPINDNYPEPNSLNEDGLIRIYPIGVDGTERVWRRSYESFLNEVQNENIVCKNNSSIYQIIDESDKRKPIYSNWTDTKYNAGVHGSNVLYSIIGNSKLFSYPKSIYNVIDCIDSFSYNIKNAIILDYFAGSGTTGHAVINLNREDGGKRKYILVEMGGYFDTVTKPRIQKVIYSKDWKDGKPTARDTGISHCFKYIRLESYEDTLNNLELKRSNSQEQLLMMPEAQKLKEDYLLNYMLDVETRGNASLLNIEMFAQPDKYKLKIKRPGSDEYEWRYIDLIETFNYLIGLRVVHYDSAKYFTAEFKRVPDPDLPEDYNTRLQIDGKMKQIPLTPFEKGGNNDEKFWWFRKIEGWLPKDSSGAKEKVLIVWRNLTGDLEQDNLMLDTWFEKNCLSSQDMEFDTIYVNGSNNLPNLLREGDIWKVRLIEQEFKKLMWDVEGV